MPQCTYGTLLTVHGDACHCAALLELHIFAVKVPPYDIL